jgi:hypothetical protein
MPPAEGEGVEPPRPLRAHPFSRRDTAPVAVLPSGPRRLRTCNLPIKSRVLCRVELRSQIDVAGRNRTCGAPRFKRALYRLSYGHTSRRGRPRTSDLLFVRQALVPTELLALDGPEGSRTLEPPLFCRSYHCDAAALPNSQLSGPQIRDKESNLDLQVQSLASCRLDDPGTLRAGAREHPLTSQHHLTRARSRATPWSFAPGARRRLDNGSPSTPHARSRRKVVSAMSRPARAEAMFSKPLALLFDPGSSRRLCASRRCRPSWRSFGARCVRVQREKA